MKRAIAIFVKTPGLSPVKTRLAKDIGNNNAELFYKLSIKKVEDTIKELCVIDESLTPFWAIAESEKLTQGLWPTFTNIYQGTGTLGERLANIYKQLISKYDEVFFIGADSPHLNANQFLKATRFNESNFIIGKSLDGGFYLFGGKTEIPDSSWINVRYSSEHTAKDLILNLEKIGTICEKNQEFDVDTYGDLINLKPQLQDNTDKYSIQINELISKILKNQLSLTNKT
jgi:glycosyltransferase A (GT-A) superfamily protein (DUF2064 family)